MYIDGCEIRVREKLNCSSETIERVASLSRSCYTFYTLHMISDVSTPVRPQFIFNLKLIYLNIFFMYLFLHIFIS